MIFETRIHGIPCQCRITAMSPAKELVITGSGFGDCIAPEPEETEYEILDRKGYKAQWLQNLMTRKDEIRIREEAADALFAERHGKDY